LQHCMYCIKGTWNTTTKLMSAVLTMKFFFDGAHWTKLITILQNT